MNSAMSLPGLHLSIKDDDAVGGVLPGVEEAEDDARPALGITLCRSIREKVS